MNDQPPDWNQRYSDGDTPWDNNRPDSELARILGTCDILPCRVLELGCGTGTNAVYLNQQGFEVTGLDISPLAIDKAQQRAQEHDADVRLLVADVFDLPDLGDPFQFVFDRGVYHVVRRMDVAKFSRVLQSLVAPGGWYLTLAGNADERDAAADGPPRVTAAEIVQELSPGFQLVQLRRFRFDPVVIEGQEQQPLAWSALWQRT